MCLIQWGVFDWGNGTGERFQIDFARQFIVATAEDDDDRMEQLHCTLPPTPVFGARIEQEQV